MNKEQDYRQDIIEIRSMMERSSKFMSLSGTAGVLAGIYALAGAWIANSFFDFNLNENYNRFSVEGSSLVNIIYTGLFILLLTIGTAIFLSGKKAGKRGEKLWNASARQLVFNMAVPLFTGGLLILIFISNGLFNLIGASSLIFYGLALYNAGKFTYQEIKSLGIIEILLGLSAACLPEYSLILWSIGFGVFHIFYGIYMYYKYER